MEGDGGYTFLNPRYRISIHTLRMEGDDDVLLNGEFPNVISIHTLRMEGDYGVEFFKLR